MHYLVSGVCFQVWLCLIYCEAVATNMDIIYMFYQQGVRQLDICSCFLVSKELITGVHVVKLWIVMGLWKPWWVREMVPPGLRCNVETLKPFT